MRWRYLPFYLALILSFWLLLIRLIDLTIVRGAYFRQLSEENRVQEKNIRAPRGIIYDRHDQVLARNKPVYKFETGDACPPSAVAEGNCRRGKWEEISRERALEIETKGGSESARLQVDLAREYPLGNLLAHVVGYIGEISPEETQDPKIKAQNYKMGDFIGRSGVEEQYEESLRGTDGKELIEVDATGRQLKSLGTLPPKPGQELRLSLDLNLQKVAAQALAKKVGAVVVSDPKTGQILALYSSPSFDPNEVEKYLNDPGKSIFNRAIAGLYPPGSTFKIITAAAGLETGKITAQTQIEDVGEINIGPFRFPNWYWTQYGKKEGALDIVKAIKRSNDIFFYKVAERVGIEKLAEWAGKFGVGKVLGIDLPGEAAGVVHRQREWFLGDTYHLAIGQGDLQVTPLQVNFWTNVIASGGKLCKPTVIKTQNCPVIGLKKETVDLIKEGMREACSPGGTGWPLFDFQVKGKKIETACKTGTAEFGDPKNRTHAWFTVFAPVLASDSGNQSINQSIKPDQVEPEISVTVLVEGEGEGSNVAAPIAKKILEAWFSR